MSVLHMISKGDVQRSRRNRSRDQHAQAQHWLRHAPAQLMHAQPQLIMQPLWDTAKVFANKIKRRPLRKEWTLIGFPRSIYWARRDPTGLEGSLEGLVSVHD